MKIKFLLIGTARQPTLNVGSNGLGRHTYDFLKKFQEKQELEITTLLHKNSILEWNSIRQLYYNDERSECAFIKDFIIKEKFDVVMDFTHHHLLSLFYKHENLPIINFIHDEECSYMPPNCMLGNEWQKKKYNNGRIFTTGIDFTRYKLYENKQNYYSFCGKLEHRKGYDIAFEISKKAGIRTIFAGPDVDGHAKQLGEWVGEITNHEKLCDFIGNSKALFYPSRSDAGGMGIWEAMALGTPVITTNQSGAQCNVINRVTGVVISNIDEANEAINYVNTLNPKNIREACKEKWDLNKNFEKIYQQVISFYNGERW